MRITHADSLYTLTVYPYRTPSLPASPPAGHTYPDLIQNRSVIETEYEGLFTALLRLYYLTSSLHTRQWR